MPFLYSLAFRNVYSTTYEDLPFPVTDQALLLNDNDTDFFLSSVKINAVY